MLNLQPQTRHSDICKTKSILVVHFNTTPTSAGGRQASNRKTRLGKMLRLLLNMRARAPGSRTGGDLCMSLGLGSVQGLGVLVST